MNKVGVVKLSNNQSYYVVTSSVLGKGERIEFYHAIEDYSVVDTSNAICAYYRKTREYYLGDDTLIKLYLSAVVRASTLKSEVKQETSFDERGFVIKQTKENTSLGITTITVLINGRVTNEQIITPDISIDIDTDTKDVGNVFVEPINLRQYKVISITTDFDEGDNVEADYWSLDLLKQRYDLDHIEDYDYNIVTSYEEAEEYLQRWKDAKVKLKAVDIETTGLDVSIFGNDILTGVVLSYDWEPLGEVENSFYFPFRQKNFKYNLPIEFLGKIADAINSQPESDYLDFTSNKGTIILAHNGKMERKGFLKEGYDIRIDVDTYSLSTLIDTRMERGLHTLKNRAFEATGLFWLELDLVFKTKAIRFDVLPPEIVKYYACPDTANTIKVFKHLFKQLPTTEYAVFDIENHLQRCKTINEYYGIRLDQENLIKELKNVEYIVDMLSTMFKSIHKTTKNINSADVLRDIVYGQLGCEVIVRTKKNKPSTSVDAIKNIVDHGKIKDVTFKSVPEDIKDLYGKTVIKGIDLVSNKYPSLVILSVYNKYKKELGALRRLQKKSNKNRVMFGINGTGAASGRQTSDAHQYSDSMKKLVLSDTPDHVLISADYSQVELRVLAYVIQDKRLIEMMKDKHIDIHRAFLSSIYGIPVHMISAVMRSNGKRVNFGVVYGISEYGLARDKYGPEYTKSQLLECSKAITDFFNGIPGVKDLANYNRDFVFSHGYIETKFGYRRIFKNAFDPDLTSKQKSSIFRAANNTPIQGFAAHLMKQAEINYDNYIRNKGWDKTVEYMGEKFPMVRVMLSIHDEVLISAHSSIPREEIVKMCKECMEISIPDAPPFFAVPAFVNNWYEGKADEFEMSISMRDDILEAWEHGHKRIVDWDNLVDSIKEYKHNQIREYMHNLISTYKTADEIIKHVDHPEYTHLLIAIYVNKDFVKTHEHSECIAEAVRAYLENADVTQDSGKTLTYNEYVEDSKIQNATEYLRGLEEYIEVDDTGEVILNDDIIVRNEESDVESIECIEDKQDYGRFGNDTVGVVYIGNIVCIDTTSITDKDNLQKFHDELSSMCNDNGYYTISYMRGSAVMPTKMRMDYCQDEVVSLIEKYSERSKNIVTKR